MATACCATGALRRATWHAWLSGQKRTFAICPLRPCLHKGTVYYRVPNPYIPVILLRSVRGLGLRGQLVQTRRGTLRNVLLPQKLAVVASWQNIDRNHLLAQEASTLGGHQVEDEPGDFAGTSMLSVPAGVFERISDAATILPARAGGGRLARFSSKVAEVERQSESSDRNDSDGRLAGVGTRGTLHTGSQNVEKSHGLRETTDTALDGVQTCVKSERAEGPFAFLKGYCARFLVDTDRSDPTVVRGRGVSLYDILSKLSEEAELDLLPHQARLSVTRVRDDTTFTHLDEGIPLSSMQEGPTGTGDVTKRIRSSVDKKRERSEEDAATRMDQDPVLRSCGSYEARLFLPLRHGVTVRRDFAIQLISKQEVARRLREKRLRQEVEARQADFSLGPDL